MKYKPLKKILILVTILAVPGFLYYLLQEKGKNRYKPLAIYGPKTVANTFHSVRGKQIPDTNYHSLSDFSLLNQNGDSVHLANYKGKILLINLFYTTGDNNAVIMAMKAANNFNQLHEKNKLINLVSVSIDPQVDNVARLKGFAVKQNAVAGKWDLLTGDTSVINNLVRNGLLLDAIKTEENGRANFAFSNMFVLLDSQHRIRGFYESTNQEALSKLEDEIKVLIAEELRNTRDGR